MEVEGETVRVRGRGLSGADIDLNQTPDALPMMAVLGCLAKGKTRLLHVPQARIKETDRIAVMAQELKKMRARIEETADGLLIEESELKGTEVHGHGDHRVVMALAVAGLNASGDTKIDTAEAVAVTFPQFADCMVRLGARIEVGQQAA